MGVMVALDVIWWCVSARLVRGKAGRRAIAIFMGAQLLGLAWIFSTRFLNLAVDQWWTKFVLSLVYLWHFLGLSLAVLICLICLVIGLVELIVHPGRRSRTEVAQKERAEWSRREFIGYVAALTPPLVTLSLTGVGLAQLNHFRVRRFVMAMPELPPALDGLTIAHVSDMHVGRFTSGRVLAKMVSEINNLRADLVLLTGDLINNALSDLAAGLDHVRAMEARFGLYLIEGNHDLIEDGPEFERRVKASGIPFLLDESAVVSVQGVPVQLLGLSWTRSGEGGRDEAIARAVDNLAQQRQTDAFPILLAHHPHAFDRAAELQWPLTLAGHTHGGQLMWNEQLGFGPAMFRYWSGLYQRGNSQLIVSNGVGNWFPLRANAPAEIVHITLRRDVRS
jgi:predicted MPP superfamily phosphohydrolase